MNLHHLVHFLAVADTGSFSRASEQLHLTQPALSRSIQMLEQDLGTRLIDRVGKRNELTPYGRMVADKARRIVADATDLRRTAELLGQGIGGSLRLGLGYAPNAMFAGPLLTYLLGQFPQLTLQLSSTNPEQQLAALRERTLDAMLVHSRAVQPDADLRIDLIGTAQSGFLCRRGHPLTQRRRVAFAEVLDYPVISTMLSDEATRTLVREFGPAAHPSRFLRASADSVGALIEAISSTDAVFLGAIGTARAWLERGEIALVDLDRPLEIDAPYAFVTLDGRTQSPVLDEVRRFCSELVARKLRIAKP
ncbi:LysR family transcriptional regulator [Burkholderia gladioli]|uniref:LysR family transcriptional regulator n=1 Tax=Burkholderia gladioli TaxID=28095 RepID=UPI0013F5E097|nr:LysR family transcriptional regulator [Burkholderia gladioli]NHH82003.1 HTH-type transcriptional regulator CynR [Burkholderia gladioli]